ncbi:hypothetical protein FPQ18DRAFT_332211 [Pyronema domesticum]|nr:hypothetical protein FPQ18DRAFT_332211 [Pyronema domesticum]
MLYLFSFSTWLLLGFTCLDSFLTSWLFFSLSLDFFVGFFIGHFFSWFLVALA